jgi:uroporphyrinogen III methyltransferase / synthase
MALGKVWLVGSGPGDPGLITLRGLEALERADVVLYDALAPASLLDRCRNGVEKHDVGKRLGRNSPTQEQISERLIEHARAGRQVVRLKGGDPLMFARGADEAEALARAGIPFEIVPGVASPIGAAAHAGISLTRRGVSSSVTFITGSDRAGVEWSPEAWKKLATATDTICVLMGMRRIEQISRAIIDGGRPPSTPAAVIQWGTRPQQQVAVASLQEIAQTARAKGMTNPAVIIIGEVVSLREQIRWYDNRPLFGKRILVPRPADQAHATARAIRERAAEPIVFPVIELVDPPDPAALLQAARSLASYDWVLFTSANGVDRFFRALDQTGRDARAFGAAKIGVIGPKTALALSVRGLQADLIAEEHVGEGLARAIAERGGARRVLIPRAREAREALPDTLRAAGAEVDVVFAYETRPISAGRAGQLRASFRAGGIDIALFTSSSTVTSLLGALGSEARELLAQVTVASIGPITGRTLEHCGIVADVTAERYTVDGLLDALERHLVMVR